MLLLPKISFKRSENPKVLREELSIAQGESNKMKTGTKSLLFGVHQVIWHPVTVLLAWIYLYRKFPGWRELICIIIHDWGYWGKPNMDGAEGETHPELAAVIAYHLFDRDDVYEYYFFCLYHSRHYARKDNGEPSKLCWADKASIMFEPWWFYLPRAWLSGELAEYRIMADRAGLLPLAASNRTWFAWAKQYLVKIGKAQRGDVVPYMRPNDQ